MKLWLISQGANTAYDSYDSAVVAAETEAAARLTHPSKYHNPWNGEDEKYSGWTHANNVEVKCIGEAADSINAGIICASFNAG